MRSSLRTPTPTGTTTSSEGPALQGPVPSGELSRRAAVIAVDANGADLGVSEVAAGAALAAQRGVNVLLFGPVEQIGEMPDGVEVIDAPVSIAKIEDPVRAVRATPEASIVQAARAVAEDRAQALVCAGGTGAALAAGLFNIKRSPGIYRPALALTLPVPGRPVTLLDVGANSEARREHLVQFAYMGAALSRALLGVTRPRVALLSNGSEPGRGTPTVIEAHAQLSGRAQEEELFEFVGNIEGTDVVEGLADVVVTDGFTGNVALKLIEGVSRTMLGAIRGAAASTLRSKLGGGLMLPSLRGLRAELDPEAHGGAYLLGLRRVGVMPHGRFARHGFESAIVRADRAVAEDLAGRTLRALAAAGALRVAPVSSEEPSQRDGPVRSGR